MSAINILLFFDVGGSELLLILLAVFILFGPKKIPEIARGLGKSIGELKKASSEIKEEIEKQTEDISKISKGEDKNINE